MRGSLLAAGLVTATSTAGSLGAQSLARGDSLLAVGDTSGAIAAYEALVADDWGNAEARYRAGVLLFSRFERGTSVSQDRRRAEEHFKLATRLDGDSAKYWVALADVLRSQSAITVRAQVPGLLNRAAETARQHGGTGATDAEFRAGVVDLERYEHYSRRYLFNSPYIAVDDSLFYEDWDYVATFFRIAVRPDPAANAEEDLRNAEEHFRQALSAEPRHVDAAGGMAVVLGEDGRWTEALETVRRLLRAAPDSGRAWALAGMVLVRLGRWREAAAAYDSALGRMSPREAEAYRNLSLLIRFNDRQLLTEATPEERRGLEQLYWILGQPLYLREVNEARLEFMARVTYVTHRWSDPLRGYQGWESDRGATYVRYGPPGIWAMLGRDRTSHQSGRSRLDAERNTIAWVYPETRLRFMFSLTPGYSRAVFTGQGETYARWFSNAAPVRFDNVPAIAGLDTIGVQVAQFRGVAPESTDVAVWGFIPVPRLAGAAQADELAMITGVTVKDQQGRDVTHQRREEVVRPADVEPLARRSWRLPVAPGDYLFRVEADVPTVRRGARSSSVLRVRDFSGDRLAVSDILLAERAAPRDSSYRRWTDFFFSPSSGRYPPNEPVSIVWEIYNLTADTTAQHRYGVELTVTVATIERRELGAQVVGGVLDAMGLTAKGDDQVTIAYDRTVNATPDGTQVEYLSLDLGSDRNASYEIIVTIHDQVANRVASVTRAFVVTETPLER